MESKGINSNNLKSVKQKRQQFIAVVFLFGLAAIIQPVNAIDYKTTTDISSHSGSNSDNSNTNIQKPTVRPDYSSTRVKSVRPAVSIIIDDIGDRLKDGMRAVSLPAPYTYSFLPNTPFASRLAKAAFKMNKEVMLHLPMQATNGKKLGPNGLTDDMTRTKFEKTLLDAYQSIPHVRGINNHMGSLLTSKKEYMNWVMSFVVKQQTELYFIDSRTTPESVIVEVAKEKNIQVLSRDTFIDFDPSVESITRQIHYLIKIAKKQGTAIGIAHPYPTTLGVLEIAWPLFYEAGVDLIPVSELINVKKKRELSEWQLSSSH